MDATDGSSISYEELGVNAFGVAVSSTETIESSEAALAVDPLNNATGVRACAMKWDWALVWPGRCRAVHAAEYRAAICT